jgi:tetratricopeptide (TPR) repeat protein
MNITRDLYGDTIYIPSLDDSNEAFRKYVDDVQAGRIQAGADIKIEGGKVSVQGVGGVMTINGILAELIFKENKDRHDFYVEESYVIQWMYPYLTPHGLILKLNREPLASLPPELVENDRRFWTWYTPWLLDRPTFRRDICARKSFSKLRSAIAGIYDYRRMYDEAEFAFKQSIELYPLSPEANFRLAQMYMNMQRFEEAETLIRGFLAQDPRNDSARGFLGQIETTRRMIDRRLDIEKRQRETGILSPDEALELVSIYRAAGMQNAYQNLAMRLVSDSGLASAAPARLGRDVRAGPAHRGAGLRAGAIHPARSRQRGCLARPGRRLCLPAARGRCHPRRPPLHRTGRRPGARSHLARSALPVPGQQPRIPRALSAADRASGGPRVPAMAGGLAQPARLGEIGRPCPILPEPPDSGR